jgi:hypothetical protein
MSLGAPIKTVNRVEAVRPDGSVLQHDWDTRVSRVHADQVGMWSWRVYLREETRRGWRPVSSRCFRVRKRKTRKPDRAALRG